jgi:hypothetical protein
MRDARFGKMEWHDKGTVTKKRDHVRNLAELLNSIEPTLLRTGLMILVIVEVIIEFVRRFLHTVDLP